MNKRLRIKESQTSLSKANRAFVEGRFSEAVEIYELALFELPHMKSTIQYNLQLSLKRLESSVNLSNITVQGITLVPAANLEIDYDSIGSWVSTGIDPYFEVDFDLTQPRESGWYFISFLIKTSNSKNIAKLYVDYGDGYFEYNSFYFSYESGCIFKKIIYLTDKNIAMRFDPVEVEGHLKILMFDIKRIDYSVAVEKMLTQLIKESEIKVNENNISVNLIKLQKQLNNRAVDNGTLFIDELLADYNQLFVVTPNTVSYKEWIEAVELPGLPSNKQVTDLIGEFLFLPLISVIVPTYNTDAIYLRACIDSVLKQSYSNWELCIADDASPKEYVRDILRYYQRIDQRIKVCFCKENGHISKASNSALQLATGDFVALLDHDDELSEHALLFMAEAINLNPEALVLYSDEDKLNVMGERFDPYFKSDWNPDLFYSQNYVSHLGIYRRSLINNIGGFRIGVEGSQDQDLLLRCLPYVKASQIIHVPRVLYHWRTVDGSTALASGEKSYTSDAGIKALKDYFAIVNSEVKIEKGILPNTYRVRWPLPDSAPLVSLLIPTRDRRQLTETCVRSILDKTTYANYEIVILDNGSAEQETLDFFQTIQAEDKRVRVLRYDNPFNFSAINNFGVANTKGEIVGLINNDIEVISPEWLSEMVSHALRPEIGCVGAKLYFGNGQIQHAGMIIGIGGVAGHAHKYFDRNSHGYFSRLKLIQNFSGVTAACLLIRRDIYEHVGGLDENNLRVAFNDVDFCLKVREAGYRNLWTPYAELYHHESISRGSEDTPEKQERFSKEVEFMKNKWGGELLYDPFYNINLTSEHEDFSIGIYDEY